MVPDTRRPDEVEYYNDLPGKTPPEFSPVQKSRLHKGKKLHINIVYA